MQPQLVPGSRTCGVVPPTSHKISWRGEQLNPLQLFYLCLILGSEVKILSVGMFRRTVWQPDATASVRCVALAFRAEVLCAFEFASAMSIDNTVYQDVTLFNLEKATAFRGKLLFPSSGCTKDGFILFVEKSVYLISPHPNSLRRELFCLTFTTKYSYIYSVCL